LRPTASQQLVKSIVESRELVATNCVCVPLFEYVTETMSVRETVKGPVAAVVLVDLTVLVVFVVEVEATVIEAGDEVFNVVFVVAVVVVDV
jgi:hypothetical protein